MGKTKAREDLLIVDELQVDLLKIDGVEVAASAAELNKLDGAIGDGLELMAYQGYWYIQGAHQVTVA